ncbi:MAG: phosphoribosylanthranilate isomerase [Gammaproteobacteria bacterium]|nr:phosphoribosylanthranilate isomerase [Gammaproteobacteria bacterium]
MTQRTRIKICGIINEQDAQLVAQCGADAIGLVFHEPSPRFIDLQKARIIRHSLPAFITVTALFLNEEPDWIKEVIDRVDPDCLQFHGTETPDACEQWQKPYIKAIPMGSVDDASGYANLYASAQGFLMDSNVAGRQGGSGDTFDWSKIPSTFHHPLILAGGLTPQNVAEAVTQVQPWAVDVSSGVEQQKGIKDAGLIKAFCREVARVDCQK